MSAELVATLCSAGSVLITIGGIVWRLSGRLGNIDAGILRTTDQLARVDSELQDIKRALDDAREGRSALWVELNGIRERTARLEERSTK